MHVGAATLSIADFLTLGSFCVKNDDLMRGIRAEVLMQFERPRCGDQRSWWGASGLVVHHIKSTEQIALAKDCRIFVSIGQIRQPGLRRQIIRTLRLFLP